MANRLLGVVVFSIILLMSGCSDSNVKPGFKIISNEKSLNNNMSIIVIKKGIEGGATVPFIYEFYFSKDTNSILEKNLFLRVKGLEKYNIKWTSRNTINLKVDASEILFFKSSIWVERENILYVVNKTSLIVN